MQHSKHSFYDKSLFTFDIIQLLLNLQESLYTSTKLRYFTKASIWTLLIYPLVNHFIWKSYIDLSL